MFTVGSAAAFAVTTNGTQTITGQKTFLAATTASVPITLRGQTGQTANLLEVRNGAGTLVNYIDANGLLGGSASDDTNALIWTQ
jgi:hypothetical protein